jgi:hypothetical protein
LHSDVNAALNIMLRGLEALGIKAGLPEHITVESFIATPSKTIPITLRKGGVTQWRALRQKKCSNQKFKGGVILSFTQDE